MWQWILVISGFNNNNLQIKIQYSLKILQLIIQDDIKRVLQASIWRWNYKGNNFFQK